MQLYKGIKNLKEFGDNFVWGGDRLFSDLIFKATPDGKAKFILPDIKCCDIYKYQLSTKEVEADKLNDKSNEFILSSRRGKQFNSMILETKDPQTGGSDRHTLFINSHDAKTHGFNEGEKIAVISTFARVECILKYADVAKSTVQMFWPECNVLIPTEIDPISGEPDYNICVRLASCENRRIYNGSI